MYRSLELRRDLPVSIEIVSPDMKDMRKPTIVMYMKEILYNTNISLPNKRKKGEGNVNVFDNHCITSYCNFLESDFEVCFIEYCDLFTYTSGGRVRDLYIV